MAHRDTRARIEPLQVTARAWVDYNAPPFPADSVTVTDSVLIEPLLTATGADTVTTTDEIAMYVDRVEFNDNVSAVDQLTPSMGFARAFGDSVSTNDTAGAGQVYGVSPEDSVTSSDNATTSYGFGRAAADSVTMSDNATSEIVVSTWNPADKSAAITLSGGDLSASNVSGTMAHVRGTVPKSTGKSYFEATVDAITVRIGIATETFVLSDASGNDDQSAVYVTSVGNMRYNNTGTGSGPSNTVGNIVSIAVDLDNGKIWYRVNGGNWMHLSSGHDPVTNTGGVALSPGLTWKPLFGALTGACTVNFGATAFAYSPPTGFVAWG